MRHELPGLIALASRLLEQAEPGVFATLFSARGSTYRTLGSILVSGTPGAMAGGVSGGCLEEYIARLGRELTATRAAAVLSFDADPDADDGKPSLGCGGSIEVLIERSTPSHLRFLHELAAAHDRDEPSLLECTMRQVDGEVRVDRQWVRSDTSALAHRAMLDGRSAHEPLANGDGGTLVQYVPPLTRLVIFGAGNDVRPLAELGASLGWHVTVADRRARLATRERFPTADRVLAGSWDDLAKQIVFTPRTAALLMTHSLADDALILPLLADRPAAYLGALGPAHRRQWLIDAARQFGTVDESLVERLHGPVGLNLGDRSATGIAVAIVSHLLAILNDRDPRPLCGGGGIDRETGTPHALR